MPKPNTYVQLLQAQKAIKQLQYNNHVIKGFTVSRGSPPAMARRTTGWILQDTLHVAENWKAAETNERSRTRKCAATVESRDWEPRLPGVRA